MGGGPRCPASTGAGWSCDGPEGNFQRNWGFSMILFYAFQKTASPFPLIFRGRLFSASFASCLLNALYAAGVCCIAVVGIGP